MEQLAANQELELQGQPITLFDVDNTLVGGFTIFPFVRHLIRQGLVKAETSKLMDRDENRYLDKKLTYEEFAREVVNHYCEGIAGSKQIDIERAGIDYLERNPDQLLPFAKDLVRLMNQHGITIAISGAPMEAFAPLAKTLGINHSYLMEAEVAAGYYTGRVKTNMALKHEKDRVVKSLTSSGFPRNLSFAFGDSSSDLPILEAVSNPFVVEPTGELEKIALERRWPTVNEENILKSVSTRLAELIS